MSPYQRAFLLAIGAVVFLVVAPSFPSFLDRLMAVLVSGPTIWLAVFSLEMARPHLNEEWHQKNASRTVSKRYSLWPSDYNQGGRSWAIRALGFLVLWSIGLIAVLLHAIRWGHGA